MFHDAKHQSDPGASQSKLKTRNFILNLIWNPTRSLETLKNARRQKVTQFVKEIFFVLFSQKTCLKKLLRLLFFEQFYVMFKLECTMRPKKMRSNFNEVHPWKCFPQFQKNFVRLSIFDEKKCCLLLSWMDEGMVVTILFTSTFCDSFSSLTCFNVDAQVADGLFCGGVQFS